mmetsp:Transcript_51267/g.85028  ORF Transcript_51267/g.85028 Transcript_51267/m.85028 type:complete len:311 (+) Transcript_51267:42-974(+)|eukprot:CAMPEP_0119314964 /NCGR_PEP_ID=MMETSP1333-20130426/34125_1 /TAXON_ID=418940 /ORGANISM="Scyphosphaera apsteinii, Strain RCC1455" /LENGTH=310 /DNA_ID=CAMNT_0007320173 /DNA_START=42 /DNA_END=974 /DNA_ORIENTATION=+
MSSEEKVAVSEGQPLVATDEQIKAFCHKVGWLVEEAKHENLIFGKKDPKAPDLTDEDGIAFTTLIRQQGPTKLRYIFFSENEFGDKTAIEIAGLLKDNLMPELEVIHIADNQLSTVGVAAITNALTEQTHFYFRELNTNKNRKVGDEAIVNLLECWKKMWEMPRVENIPWVKLCMAGHIFEKGKISDDGVVALCDALMNRDFFLNLLEELDLSDNQLTDVALEAIAACIAEGHFKRLKSLYLTSNKITNTGALALADAIKAVKKPCKLFDIRLDYQEVTKLGKEAIIQAGEERGTKTFCIIQILGGPERE